MIQQKRHFLGDGSSPILARIKSGQNNKMNSGLSRVVTARGCSKRFSPIGLVKPISFYFIL